QEIEMYKQVREGYDFFLQYLLQNQARMAFKDYKNEAWLPAMIDLFSDVSLRQTDAQKKALSALNKLALNKIRGKKAETIQKNRAALMAVVKEHIATVSGITDQTQLSKMASGMLEAYKKERTSINAVKKARNRIGQQVAYVPQVREDSGAYLNIYRAVKTMGKDGKEVIRQELVANYPVPEKAIYKVKPELRGQAIREIWEDYKSRHKNEELSYKVDKASREMDTTYRGVNDMNLQRVIDNAVTSIKETKNFVDGPILNDLKASVIHAVANEMKARGFGRSLISRKLRHIEGYKTTDIQKITVDYITGMTGMITKQEAALNAYDILKEIPKKNSVLYNDIAKYTQDMLRNQNRIDRASGKAKGLLFTWYLSGLLKMVPIQLTQNYVTGMPKLAEKMREWGMKGFSEAKYHKAMADATTIRVDKNTKKVRANKRINDWEARLLTESLQDGTTADQYVKYITGQMDTQFGQWAEWGLDKLSKPFSWMETFNRESASLAMFRMAWNHYTETVPDLEERYQKAKHEAGVYVEKTHFGFGKENLPRIATGGDTLSVAAKTLMTFRSFNHNYLQFIFGSKDWKTMAHSLAYVALFGGMMGLPFIKDLLDLLEKYTGRSYTKSAREVMRKFGGKTFETFGIQGLPALAGANLSGSLAMGIPFADWMTGSGGASDTIYGVVGGMGEKVAKGINYGLKGEFYKAGESFAPQFIASPMQAMRMSEIGKEYLGTTGYATTSKGKPQFDENGKPLSMDTGDVIAKVMGFNPSDYSMRTEAQRSASNIEEYFSDWKTSIYETYRAGRTNHDSKTISKAMRQIREFNQAIVDKGASGLIQRIKLSNVVKASKMEMTKKQKREALYKKNYLAS
ncbi:MAG: PLxRFG domain-containing protein, partial [Bacteroidales bacterium]